MASLTYKGKQYSLSRKPPQAVGWGVKQAGNKGQLILVLRKKGETPREAIERVGARHPQVEFTEFDEGSMFDASRNFGVDEGSLDQLVFDLIFDDQDNMYLHSKHAEAAAALGSAELDDEEVFNRLMSDMFDEEEGD